MEDKLRILLIEDDTDAAQLMLNVFAGMGAGFELVRADCLSKGMEHLVPGSSPKDAILLDLSLPDSQGLDSFTRIHAKAPQIPVLVLTGTHDETPAMEAIRAGAQDYLIKNEVDGRSLVKAIRNSIERCKAKKALSDSERMLSELISRIPGVVYRCKNDPDWTMEYVGRGMQELTGYSSKGFILGQTHSFSSIIVPEDHSAVCAEIRKALDARQPYVIEYRIVTASGDRKRISDRGSAVFSDNNEIIAREGFLMDITRDNEVEKEIRKLNEELEERVRQRTAELTEANEALRKSESTLRSVFSASPVGIHIISMDRKIRWMNDRMTAITGYRLEDIKNGNPRIFYSTEEEFARVGEIVFQRVLRGNMMEIETQWVRKDGQIRDIHLGVAPIDPDDASAGQVSAVTDITERKEAAKKLLESEERYRTVIEHSNVGIALVQDGVHVYVNSKFLEIFGYNIPEEVLGKRPMMTVHPDDQEMMTKRDLRRRQSAPFHDRYQFKGVKKNGDTLYVEVSASSMSFRGKPSAIAFIKDITEQKEAERKLIESEERYRTVIEHSNDGVALVQNGKHVYVNRMFFEMFGYDSEEGVLDKPIAEIIHPDDLEMVLGHMRKRAQGKTKSARYSFRGLRKDGSIVYIEASGTTILYRGEAVTVGFLRDITARKNAEEALRASEERFRTLLLKSEDIIVLSDTNFKRLYISPSVETTLGYTPEEYLAMKWPEGVHPDDIETLNKNWALLLQHPDKTISSTVRLRHKDGSWHWMEISVRNLLDNPNVQAFVINHHDITERRKAQDALAQSEARFRTIVEQSHEVIFLINADQERIYVSPAVTKILGFSQKEFLALDPASSIHPDDRDRAAFLRNWTKEHPGETVTTVCRRQHKDGGWRWMENTARNLCDDPNVQAMVLTFHDMTERRMAEEALRESEERFRTLIEESAEVISLTNINRERVYVSPSVKNILGYSMEEYRALKWDDLCHPDDFHMLQKNREWMLEHPGETVSFMSRIRHKDGTWRWMENTASNHLDNPSVRAVVTNFHDITERKLTTDELKQKTEELDRFFSINLDLLCIADTDGNFRRLNHAWETTLGYELSELEGKRFLDFVHPDDMAGTLEATSILSNQQTVRTFVNRYRCRDGSYRWIEWISAPAGNLIYAAARDITDRKTAEEALQRTNTLLNTIIDTAPTAIIGLDLDGKVHMVWNRAAEKMLGWSAQEAMGQFLPSVPVEKKEEFEHFRQFIRNGQNLNGIDVRRLRRDGTPIDYSIYGSPLYDGQGEITGNIAVLVDITDRKRAEQALLQAKDAAESATRAKSNFLANMSHEIRTPMNAIIGLSRLALKQNPSVKQQDYLNKIQSSARTLLGIINDILDLSKIEAGRLEINNTIFNLDKLIQNISTVIGLRAQEKGLNLSFHRDPDVPLLLMGDPLRLGQILINLIGNAVKFTDVGEIVVEIKKTAKEKRKEAFLEFSIRDTGIGMTPEQTSVIFTPFAQADASMTRRYGGTGLGLTISKQLVEQMGGTISVVSAPDVGSTFTFTVSLKPVEKKREREEVHPDNLKALKVLVVDDNGEDRAILAAMLSDLSCKNVCTDSGAMALRELEKKRNRFDLVLIDWNMPGIDGIELAKWIKKHPDLPKVPKIILVTTDGWEDAAGQAEELEIEGFLTKPVDKSILLDTIMGVLDQGIEYFRDVRSIDKAASDETALIRGARILLVEDNEINRQVAKEILEGAGFIVELADNGLEAIERVANPTGPLDALLMDIQMPGMDGFEASRNIRSKLHNTALPIIAMTAHAMESDRQNCLRAGMNDYVPKPIDSARLITTLARWVKPRGGILPVAGKSERPRTDIPGELLSSLPGVNIETALKRMSGNKQLLARLLLVFADNYAGAAEDIRKALSDENIDLARRLTHNLKGISGNLSADEVFVASRDLEEAIKNSDKGRAGICLAKLEKGLKKVSKTVKKLSIKDTTQKGPSVLRQEALPDREKIGPLLIEIYHLLNKNSLTARKKFIALEEQFDRRGPRPLVLEELEDALNRMDFKSARRYVSSVARLLGIELR
jgi:two-component system, sensor histidine kinase and response regulator